MNLTEVELLLFLLIASLIQYSFETSERNGRVAGCLNVLLAFAVLFFAVFVGWLLFQAF